MIYEEELIRDLRSVGYKTLFNQAGAQFDQYPPLPSAVGISVQSRCLGNGGTIISILLQITL